MLSFSTDHIFFCNFQIVMEKFGSCLLSFIHINSSDDDKFIYFPFSDTWVVKKSLKSTSELSANKVPTIVGCNK